MNTQLVRTCNRNSLDVGARGETCDVLRGRAALDAFLEIVSDPSGD